MYVYRYKYMHAITIREKRDFESENKERTTEQFRRKEKNNVIIL